uniref:J domain-containing protein n=1 Tax=Eutreptiella gymnastica TaxID=73025 RepID=A0A7S4GBK5_9EUGL|mmetsp:Transcript_39289/g.65223  ORF Transcript_39289/g.65223 Transcript_39289/m.65223 type:complete len:287 (+) Transcript_39289:74-934(+)|eukprot:CAMPEP_0174315346 /NCGR_PEP_ID=MMETSP0810-20121108/6233_1 /TAXON_ID=73025 ORGANISM="Eutreptiella gymnastica-like, Strain CCMP1594" /NCGR_SAMPLE_ID=MMETSP0810 /ASSEMBLY_ACC=CAM_ASM_000659 /LENGTH=286 /DNA_ID=CAMNT_0015424717 /DNA_START=73 /DNA_END=933 /DNA_ORIENTATION=+
MSDDDEVIQRILRSKNLYDILGAPKTADEDDLRRKYKKLALTCHPDKCKHPKAEEAFKAVGKAWATLSDPQKRAQYDRYGEEGVRENGGGPRYHHAEELHPEDVFDIFAQMFGADIRDMQGRRYTNRQHPGRRAQHHHQQQQSPMQNPMQLFQVLPIIIFFLVYSLFSIGSHDRASPFSLHEDHDHGYTVRRRTKEHRIPYWVQSTFTKDFRDPYIIQNLEHQVYQSHKGHLHRRCNFEQKEKFTMRQRANRFYSGQERIDLLDKADRMPTKSCDELQKLINKYGY